MKHTTICLSILLLNFLNFTKANHTPLSKEISQDSSNFKLSYVSVGLGQNMYEMQPVFKVNGTRFIYTSEEVWIYPDQKKVQRDTLLMGNLRNSSIDSITDLIKGIKDSVVYRIKHFSSGSIKYIKVSTERKKVRFQLDNASDTTAEKIVNILNSYIPKEYGRLY